jgi:methionine-rich copper-binding protein CopC
MSIRRRAILAIPMALLLMTDRAVAHGILLRATPTPRAMVTGPDIPITLRFNSRIDRKRSRLILVGPGNGQRILEIAEHSAPDVLVSNIKGLAPGSYALRWQVLASDGHITRGEVPFSVH